MLFEVEREVMDRVIFKGSGNMVKPEEKGLDIYEN